MVSTDPKPEDMEVGLKAGKFVVLWSKTYGGGHASFRTFDTAVEAEAWIDGYKAGARENM